jgi:hypothetical protein
VNAWVLDPDLSEDVSSVGADNAEEVEDEDARHETQV